AEKLVSSGDWYLGVNGSKLALNKPQAGVILTGEEINPGYWTHIALTWDGKTINLYRNGNKVASASYSGSLNITEEIVFGGGFIGDIDQLRVKDRSVSRSSLHFDLRINYLLGFPIISWVQKNLTPEELWRFYAGFFFSNISIKRESGQYSVTGKKLNQVAEFLLAETDKNRKIPSDLSEGLLEDIKKMRDLGGDGEITEEETGSLDQILENLSNYLGLS
ncbi:MAG: LamG domain-containing protein, partial [Candidatus Bipolaricaulia bacterium]